MTDCQPLERARRRLAQRRREVHINVQVPGWGDDLIARFEPRDDHAREAIASWHSGAGVDATADMVAAAVTRLYARDADGKLVALVDPVSGVQLCFDGRLGPALGVPYCTTPRAAVMLVFSEGEPATIDVAGLNEFAASIQRWHRTNAQP
ncbi:MAG: hypothetical protein JWQ48_199 [Conexibacter sp.]|nr:hypothetical protein [Conexibacter sp.]